MRGGRRAAARRGLRRARRVPAGDPELSQRLIGLVHHRLEVRDSGQRLGPRRSLTVEAGRPDVPPRRVGTKHLQGGVGL